MDSLLGAKFVVNELFVREHTYEVVSVLDAESGAKYGLQPLDENGDLIKGLITVTAKQLRQLFIQEQQ